MNLADDLLAQLKDAPHWLLVLLGLTAFGIYWKKSQWPNKYLPLVNLLLPAIAYPLLHYSPDADHSYWNPWAVLALHGLAIGVVSEFAHEGIVTKLKAMFPSLAFPPDTQPATRTTPPE